MFYLTNTVVFLVGICVGHLPCNSALRAESMGSSIQDCLAERDKRRLERGREMSWHCAINPDVEGVDE